MGTVRRGKEGRSGSYFGGGVHPLSRACRVKEREVDANAISFAFNFRALDQITTARISLMNYLEFDIRARAHN